jgi:hypothetical protein
MAYGTGSAYAFTGQGVAGEVLQSNGAGVPTWTNGNGLFIRNQSSLQSGSNFYISGIGRTDGSFQSPVYTRADAGTVAIRPNTNSATAVQIQNAGGTNIFNVDATNLRVGIGSAAPLHVLHVEESAGDAAISGIYVNEANAGNALSINEAGAGAGLLITSNDNGAAINSTAQGAVTNSFTGHALSDIRTSSTASITKTALAVSSTGTWNGAGAINRGLTVDVSGGTVNYAALFAGGNVGIGTTAPMQMLDVNGKINVTEGVIQRGGAAITATTDLGLYSRVSGNWVRYVTNAADHVWFTDDGSGGIGTTARMRLSSSGDFSVNSLAGTGNRPVYADAGGVLKAGRSVGDVASFNSSIKPSPDDLANNNVITGDEGISVQNLGFNFNIGGTIYSQVTISTNGYIVFGNVTEAVNDHVNVCLPTTMYNNPMICAYWDDLVTEDDQIDTELLGTASGRIFIIQGEEYVYNASANDVNWQITIHESGLITVKYFPDMPAGSCGQSATIGFQGAGGASAKAYQISCNARVIDDNAENDQSWSIYIPQNP